MKINGTPTRKLYSFGQWPISKSHSKGIALVAALALLKSTSVTAQTDNFDSYSSAADMTAAGWKLAALNAALVTTTFPATPTGKGLRIQANPIASAAPAVGMWYRTNLYSDFYMAVDIADWPGTDKNQAMVLFGRMTDATTGTLPSNLNPAAGQGVICNYDASQYGEGATSRRQGQLQINVITAIPNPFTASTRAVAEITFVPGRAYRIVFKCSGTLFTAQAYDRFDLTTPLVTLTADIPDVATATGGCGILGFSREGTTGLADATYDNYYAGTTDPNVAPVPALSHPIAGTPQVVVRTPANRFANFHPAASGISFEANSFGADLIDTAATKLYLNGADATAALAPLPANGTSASFTTTIGALVENTIYSARIELQNVGGTKKSTNTFWFDTYTDTYLATSPVKTIEVEDYNYSSGQYQLDPIPVSGFDTNNFQISGNGTGYLDQPGVEGVDFHDNRTSIEGGFDQYRLPDLVGTVQGPFVIQDMDHTLQPPLYDDGGISRANDTTRQQYAAQGMREYQVTRTEVGEWLNYTRAFPNTNYYVYIRASSFGASAVDLSKVSGDTTTTNQTATVLGTFTIPNQFTHGNYLYQQLMSNGAPAVVNLAGTNTIRLTMAGTSGQDSRKLVLNYLLFVPVPPGPITVFDNFNDGNDTANPVWDHYDPIFDTLGAPFSPATFTFPGSGYRIYAPAPPVGDAGPARAGSFLHGAELTDFYVSADVLDFDDTVRQAFGIAARINTPGLGTTGGYLFSWEPGGGALPGTNNGDLDISRLVSETPVGQIETAPSGLHLEKGKSYRFVFMGKGNEFMAEVYQLPDTANPLIRLPATDPDNLYPSGQVGLIVASQGNVTIPGDATFDNFLVTTAEPRLSVEQVGANIKVTWPDIPFRFQSSTSLNAPNWADVTSGITTSGGGKVYTSPASGTTYYRLVYP